MTERAIVGPDQVVSIEYRLTDEQGNLIDTSDGGDPLVYLHGHGQIIPGLEKALEGSGYSIGRFSRLDAAGGGEVTAPAGPNASTVAARSAASSAAASAVAVRARARSAPISPRRLTNRPRMPETPSGRRATMQDPTVTTARMAAPSHHGR